MYVCDSVQCLLCLTQRRLMALCYTVFSKKAVITDTNSNVMVTDAHTEVPGLLLQSIQVQSPLL